MSNLQDWDYNKWQHRVHQILSNLITGQVGTLDVGKKEKEMSMQVASFEEYKFDICPVCGYEVWPGDEAFEHDGYFTNNVCEHCGASWTAFYCLEDVTIWPSELASEAITLTKKEE